MILGPKKITGVVENKTGRWWGMTFGHQEKGTCFEHLKLKVDLRLEEGEYIGAKGGGPATWMSCD